MEQWHITPQAVHAFVEQMPENIGDGFLWMDLSYTELEQQKLVLQQHPLLRLSDLHLNEINNNNGQPYFDSCEQYDLLIVSTALHGSEPPKQLQPMAIICFQSVIVTVSHFTHLSSTITNVLSQKSKKSKNSKESLLHALFGHIEKGFLKLRDHFSYQLQSWRTDLLNSSGEFSNLGELAKLQDDLRRVNLTLDQQYEILDQWQNDEENSFIDFYVLNMHYHSSQFSRIGLSIQSFESKIESLLTLNYIAQGHYTNEILRILAVISGIFLPLSFLTSFFGMNLNTLPLQNDEWGSYLIIIVMLIMAVILLYIFKKKKWL